MVPIIFLFCHQADTIVIDESPRKSSACKRVPIGGNKSSDDDDQIFEISPFAKKPKTRAVTITISSESESEYLSDPEFSLKSAVSLNDFKDSIAIADSEPEPNFEATHFGNISATTTSSKSKVFSKFSEIEVKSCEKVPHDID